MGKERPGSAVLTERLDRVELGTRKVTAILATLSLRIPNGKIELESWYQDGVGLIQQEQRTNGARIVQLQLLEKGGD
jgi:limonene-1,2-epoxide hydrolase